MSRSLHATSTEKTEMETTTTIINNKVESSVVDSNNIANNNKKHASMSSSQIPVLSKVRSLINLSCFFRGVFSFYFMLFLGNCWKKKKYLFLTGFWGKEAWRPPPKWNTRFFFAFSKRTRLWLVYLRFEGNGKIPLGR